MIYLDFETRSEVNLVKSGAWVYSVHPSTEILCMAYAFDKGPVQLSLGDTITRKRMSAFEVITNQPGHIFSAHNAMFEIYIWHNILVKRYGWPEIPLKQWRCTAAKASSHGLPRALEKAALALGSPFKKDMAGGRIMLKMCKPRNPTKKNKAKWHNDPEDYEKLYEYCKQDVEVERWIDQKLPDLNEKEQKVWFLDQIINARGVSIDTDAVAASLHLLQKYTEKSCKELEFLTNGYLSNVSRRQRTLNWFTSHGIKLKDFTKETVNDALNTEGLPGNVRRVLEIRQELGRTSTAKYQAMLHAVDSGGRMRDTLLYHGASTGRWSGKRVQLHNLPKGTIKDTETCISFMKEKNLEIFEYFYPEVMEAISSCIRGMIIAKAEHTLLVVDYGAIEARVLLWLAGDEKGLDEYRRGVDRYVLMAQHIYNKKEISKEERAVGKMAVLACGYGMGAQKFEAQCKTEGVKISSERAVKAVNTFRTTQKSIRSMWYKQEGAAVKAIQTRKIIKCGKVAWGLHKGFLYCRLPSGRCLAYYNPKIVEKETKWGNQRSITYMGVDSITKAFIRLDTYGGKLTANITSAIARDIMAGAMLRCEEKGYPIVLSVHDELVAEVPEKYGQESLLKFIELMEWLPPWAHGCPIKAEGWVGKRYKK